MVRGGRHDIAVYLDLAGALASDDAAAVVRSIAERLAFTAQYLAPSGQHSEYQRWIREQFGSVLRGLGVPGPQWGFRRASRHSRRAELVELVGVTGSDAEIQQQARLLARQYMANPASIPATLAPALLRVAAVSGDAALYDEYLARLRTLNAQPDEYYRFFNALPWFCDPALAQRTLSFAVSSDVRSQDMGGLLAGMLARPWSRDAAWAFIKARGRR